MQGSFEITREIDIDASPEMVFRFFTEPALLERWLCVQADVDARPGGGYVFNVTGSHTTRGTFLVVEPGRRLVYTWLFDHVAPPLPNHGGGNIRRRSGERRGCACTTTALWIGRRVTAMPPAGLTTCRGWR